VFLGSAGTAIQDYRVERALSNLQQQQAVAEQRIANERSITAVDHHQHDEQLTNLALDMMPDIRAIANASELDEKQREEVEKRLQRAADLLNRSKEGEKDDLLDCHRALNVMIELRNKVDEVVRAEIEHDKLHPDKNPRLVIPLERLQLKSGMATQYAVKEFAPKHGEGNRTETFLTAIGLETDLLGLLLPPR